MREILFRGKRIDNGEWVEGYYTDLPVGSFAATIFSNDEEIVCEDTESYIIEVYEKQHSNYPNSIPLRVVELEKYQVAPETVGQCTGLTDENGKKIFEGDILKILSSDCGQADEWISVVKYDEYGFSPFCDQYNCDGCECSFELDEYEVIGNIYDNPELLEAT